jgi:two-component system, NtrC family, sensor kinase
MTGRVLIADDSLTVRMDLAEAFEAAGFAVSVCSTLAAAREALRTGDIALAVLDVRFPDGDGVELLQEIREAPQHGSVAVLMLSNEAEIVDRVRGMAGGADDYVGKPYDRDTVVARARELLRVAGPGSARPQIVIADDSPTFRESLREALEGAGYQVHTAENGLDGLRLVAELRPTAVIVDGVMPGIDGATVIRRMRLDAALRGTPCLLLTASEDSGAEVRALEAGADAFVRKEEPIEVILARVAAVLRSARSQPSSDASLLGPKRLLAVDDSRTYLCELAAALGREGHDVVQATSGEEALEILALQRIDCVLLDLVMPGMGGRETCVRIKASPGLREIPLVLVTASEDRALMVDALAAGADDCVHKSSDFDVLSARVRAQLRRKQFEDEHRRIQDELRRSELEAAEERAARRVAETRAMLALELAKKNRELEALAEDLGRKNRELEAFSYSASHDLRAPLRSISGFSELLLTQHAEQLDKQARDYLTRVRAAAKRMGELIDDLLELSQISMSAMTVGTADLSTLAREVADVLRQNDPERRVEFAITPDLVAPADARLIRVLFENLLGNAWKFTARTAEPRIEVGAQPGEGETVYYVRDNGAGFDMTYAGKLFRPFQRLHDESFPGTGIGLATVHRVVERHRGRVWAEGAVGRGAAVFFALPHVQS